MDSTGLQDKAYISLATVALCKEKVGFWDHWLMSKRTGSKAKFLSSRICES